MATNATSIVEHLTIGDTEATLRLDGREIRIGGDAFTPSLRALKGLYAEACAAIEAHEAAMNRKPGALRRIGALGKRLLARFGSNRIFFSPAGDKTQPTVPGDTTGATILPTSLGASYAASAQPAASGIPTRNMTIEAIFADRMGVRVLWGHPASAVQGIERKEVRNLTALPAAPNHGIAR